MGLYTPSNDEVVAAAEAIIRSFAATDTHAYFESFSSEATFVFHSEKKRLNSRASYEALWYGWLDHHWHVTACESTDRLVQTFPGGAVFSHTVHTSSTSDDGADSYIERETIVFRTAESQTLIAIHEHLSTVPCLNNPDTEESIS